MERWGDGGMRKQEIRISGDPEIGDRGSGIGTNGDREMRKVILKLPEPLNRVIEKYANTADPNMR
jgi:hypothetical protein